MPGFFRKKFTIRRPDVEIDPEEIFLDSLNPPGFREEMAEGRIERPISRSSLLVAAALLSAGFLALTGRLVWLQVIRGGDFFLQAQTNKTYPILLVPPRGIFYDRKGEKLVENAPTFVISLRRGGPENSEAFFGELERLAALTHREISGIAEDNGLQTADAYRPNSWPSDAFIAAGDLIPAILEIRSRPDDFPATEIAEAGRRQYPLGSAASHLLGYVGRPSREDLSNRPDIKPADAIGKAGLELFYDEFLAGGAGKKLLEINARGQALRERFIVRPVPGNNVILEIDAGLQRFAASTLERHLHALGKRAGVVIAVDPHDGAVRALASFPGYDPNIFGRAATQKDFLRLLNDPAKPFFNRAVSGGYPSGSTIKPILAAAALEEGIIDPERAIYDPGYISVPNPYDPANPTIFKDWKELGWVDMRRALAFSANVYFYTVGGGYRDIKGLGIERIKKWLERFGWGKTLGIDLPGEYGGLVPDPEKKKTIRPQDPVWRIGDTYITSIGQGDLQITPLQLASSIAAIANNGDIYKPRLARAVEASDGELIRTFEPEILASDLARPEHLDIVRQGMRQAVAEGSARALDGLFFSVAGKTGTAQTGAYGKNHGWFAGFAPYEKPEIVIVVLVEEGTGGSTDAVPIAKEVLYYYFTHKSNSPLTVQ